MFVLLLFATKRSWIKYMDESDNVINSKLDVNSILSQRDLIEALHKLSPTLAFSKSTVLAALAAITEIKGWKLDESATEAMHKILGARLRNMCRHVSQAEFFSMCFQTVGSYLDPAYHARPTLDLRSDS